MKARRLSRALRAAEARTRSTSAKASATDFTLSMVALRDEEREQARLPNPELILLNRAYLG
jgi:hypothetical protein